MLSLKVIQVELDKRRITLSLKQSKGDPWVGAEHKYAVGTVVEGKVINVPEFGAFIELEPGVEGLVHISELSHKRVGSVAEVLTLGQREKFRVIEVDEEQRRIKLSLKQVADPPPAPAPSASETRAPAKPTKPAKRKPSRPLKGGIE